MLWSRPSDSTALRFVLVPHPQHLGQGEHGGEVVLHDHVVEVLGEGLDAADEVEGGGGAGRAPVEVGPPAARLMADVWLMATY